MGSPATRSRSRQPARSPTWIATSSSTATRAGRPRCARRWPGSPPTSSIVSRAEGWTARQIVHHLADSEANSYIRLRRLLAEDDVLILGYDQDEWASRLHYDRPIEPSLAVLDAVRLASTQLLRTLDDAAFERTGKHSESGDYGVDTWLAIYADHAHDHADQIRRARQGRS